MVTNSPTEYKKHKADANRRRREVTAKGKEIGKIPEVVDPERRNRGRDSLLIFGLQYFPGRLYDTYSADHETACEVIDECTINGGLFALAMPRGSGKTTWAEIAAIRALVYGLRKYVVPIGATGKMAGKIMDSIKREFEDNDLLNEDFPEVCYPIRCLEREVRRCKGQTYQGESTHIEWGAELIVLPTIPGSAASGAIVEIASLEGAIRGLKKPGPDGQVYRPDLLILDDPQTSESANQLSQTIKRYNTIMSDCLGLAGPGKKIAAVMLCTVIRPGDLSERVLDREKNPIWQGLRTRMLSALPTNMTLWDEYYELRKQELRDGIGVAGSNQFYLDRQEQMDAGCKASWESRYDADEVSAIQSAMNLYYRAPGAFMAEYQNDPEAVLAGAGARINDRDTIMARVNDLKRNDMPIDANRVTAFIDVGGEVMWFLVTAWDELFNGWVIDYGTYPRQERSFFTQLDVRPGLSDVYTNYSEEQRVYAGIEATLDELLARRYQSALPGSKAIGIERILVDSGWNTKLVSDVCKQQKYRRIVWSSKGFPRTATSNIGQWKSTGTERAGQAWRYTLSPDTKYYQLQFDADHWKSFTHERLHMPLGGKGVLTLFGQQQDPKRGLIQANHEMFAEHCSTEYSEVIAYKGANWDKWEKPDKHADNHLWDCVIGATLAASTCGLKLTTSDAPKAEPKPKAQPKPIGGPASKPISMEELWKLKQQRRRR